MKVLVTGGCGFIGSHTCVELLMNQYEVIVIDDLSSSKKNVSNRIEKITNKNITLYKEDLCDKEALRKIFSENEISAVIHLAGVKGLDVANKNPITFYRNNVAATICLLEIMEEFGCKKLVFGSSSKVYGNDYTTQISEEEDPAPDNIIGYSKMMCEKILLDVYERDNNWSIAVLRHFNPAGAHKTGLLGESIEDMPSTLIPRLVKVATGNMDELEVYGDNYDTEDGTGRRDYTHVCDVARAHVKALEKVLSTREYDCYNLGTGYSHSVLDVIKIFETVNDVKINYTIKDRREGDAAVCFANPDYTLKKIGWQAEKDLGDICMDSYNYIIKEYIDNDDDEEEIVYDE